jgi:hypothetical protein
MFEDVPPPRKAQNKEEEKKFAQSYANSLRAIFHEDAFEVVERDNHWGVVPVEGSVIAEENYRFFRQCGQGKLPETLNWEGVEVYLFDR